MVLRRLRSAAIRPRRQKWAVEQVLLAAKASHNLGLSAHATFSGALAWPFVYPWPQRPAGLVETAFDELARRWTPILNAFDEAGVDLCYEIHPGEDLHDGITFEMFLERVNNHRRCNILYDPSHFLLQQLDYLQFIDIYHQRIRMFHAKDAEFNASGRQGVYSGFQPWVNRAGRFRSLGDGQVEFGAIFSKLSQYGFDGWAVLEWECCIKDSEQGAAEGARLSRRTSSRLPPAPSTTSRPAASTRRPTASCWGWADDPSYSPGHGGRRPGRLHRRRAPHRGPAGRPVRIGRRRAVVRSWRGRTPARRRCISNPDAAMPDSRRWRSARRRGRTASMWWRS